MPAIIAGSVEPEVSPGDVYPAGWDEERAERFGAVVVMSHGCEVDKSATILIANLENEFPGGGFAGSLRAGKVWHGVFLEELTPAAWVNLRTSRYVPKDRFLELKDRRTHSMTEDGRILLATKFFSNMTRALPPAP